MQHPQDTQALPLTPALDVWENEGGAPARSDGDSALDHRADLDFISLSAPPA